MKFFTILQLVITLEIRVVLLKKTCEEDCGNMKKLAVKPPETSFTAHIPYEFDVTIYPQNMEAKILKRERFSKWLTSGFSTSYTKHYFKGFEVPEESEALEWKRRGMCAIGNECFDDGECYGGDAEKCVEKVYNNWVNYKEIRRDDPIFQMTWKSTCIQYYGCSIETRKLQIKINSRFRPTIVDCEQDFEVFESKKYYKCSTFGIFIEETFQIIRKQKEINCLLRDSSYYCSTTQDNDNVEDEVMFVIEKGKKCSEVKNTIYCLKNQISVMRSNPLNDVIVSDINEVQEMFLVSLANTEYSIFNLKKNLLEIQEKFNSLLTELSVSYPFLIGKLLNDKSNVHIQKSKYIEGLEICRCDDKMHFDSEVERFKVENITKLNKMIEELQNNSSNIYLFDSFEKNEIMPDKINILGKTKTIFESDIERNYATSAKYDSKFENLNKSFSTIPTFNLWDIIFANLSIINSCLIFYLILKTPRL